MPEFSVATDGIGARRLELRWQNKFHLVEISTQLQSELPIMLCLLCHPCVQANRLVIEFIRIISTQADRTALFFILPGPIEGRIDPETVGPFRGPGLRDPGLAGSRMMIDPDAGGQRIPDLPGAGPDPF